MGERWGFEGFSWSWSFSKIRIMIKLFLDIGSTFLKIAVNISSQSLTLFDYVTFMVLAIFSLPAQLFKTKARLFDFGAIFLYQDDFSKITLLRFEWSLSKKSRPRPRHFFIDSHFSLSSTFQKPRGNRDQNQPSLFIKIKKNLYKNI